MDPRLVQSLDLVFHQRDQRGYHHSDPRQHQSRDLVAYGFSRPGGHDAQYVPSRQDAVDQHLLSRAEAGVSEVCL